MINLLTERYTLAGALQRYDMAWKQLIQANHLEDFSHYVRPNTVSWKVADKDRLFANVVAIAPQCEQLHVGTVNDRFIASCVLHEPIEANLWIVKILERRKSSTDPLGLDSIDYLVPDLEKTFQGLQAAGLEVVRESNEVHAWLSLRFGANDEFEAKFTDHLVLQVAQKELKLTEDRLLQTIRL